MEKEFSQLKVFNLAHKLALETYELTNKFPSKEQYSLTSQLRRAVVSVPANIAEGNARNSKKEFIRFLFTAKGSLAEVKYFLLLSKDLNYISQKEYNQLSSKADEVGKMLSGLIKYLKSSI